MPAVAQTYKGVSPLARERVIADESSAGIIFPSASTGTEITALAPKPRVWAALERE